MGLYRVSGIWGFTVFRGSASLGFVVMAQSRRSRNHNSDNLGTSIADYQYYSG